MRSFRILTEKVRFKIKEKGWWFREIQDIFFKASGDVGADHMDRRYLYILCSKNVPVRSRRIHDRTDICPLGFHGPAADGIFETITETSVWLGRILDGTVYDIFMEGSSAF